MLVDFPVPYRGVCVLPGRRAPEECLLVARMTADVPEYAPGDLPVAAVWNIPPADLAETEAIVPSQEWEEFDGRAVFHRGPEGDLLCPLVQPVPDFGGPADMEWGARPGMRPDEAWRDGFGGPEWETRRGEACVPGGRGSRPVPRALVRARLGARWPWPFAPEGINRDPWLSRDTPRAGCTIVPEDSDFGAAGAREARPGERDAALARASALAARCAVVGGRLHAPGHGPCLVFSTPSASGLRPVADAESLRRQPRRIPLVFAANSWFGPSAARRPARPGEWTELVPWALRGDAAEALGGAGVGVVDGPEADGVVSWSVGDDPLAGSRGPAWAVRRAVGDVADGLARPGFQAVIDGLPAQDRRPLRRLLADIRETSAEENLRAGDGPDGDGDSLFARHDRACGREPGDALCEATARFAVRALPAFLHAGRGRVSLWLWAPLLWAARPDLRRASAPADENPSANPKAGGPRP